MKLDISFEGLVHLEINGLSLRCQDNDGIISTHSLEGITNLWCSNNQLQSLPTLPNGLKVLDCGNNQLLALSTLPETLRELHCENNRLSDLPTLPDGLKVLDCGINQLQSLPVLPNGLRKLYCSNNQLQNLPTLPNSLEVFYCYNNPLIFVRPLAKRPKLYRVPKNLRFLHLPENYSNFCEKYQTYVYLITYLALEINVSPTILSRERWLFFI